MGPGSLILLYNTRVKNSLYKTSLALGVFIVSLCVSYELVMAHAGLVFFGNAGFEPHIVTSAQMGWPQSGKKAGSAIAISPSPSTPSMSNQTGSEESLSTESEHAADPVSGDVSLSNSVFIKDPDPVLTATEPWESTAVYEPTVMYEGGMFKMWYSGGTGNCYTGYATSPDGVHWTKYAGNPILGETRGGINYTACRNNVFKYDGVYYAFTADANDGMGNLYVSTSSDGIHFNTDKYEKILNTGWFQNIANTFEWVEGGVWSMIYESNDSSDDLWKMGFATGTDAYHWKRDDSFWTKGDAAFPLSSLQVGRGMYGGPWVSQLGDTYYMWHQSSIIGNLPTDIYLHSSTDLLHWNAVSSAPVLARTLPWEVDQVADPSVVEANSNTYMFYDGDDNTHGPYKASIGVAVFHGSLGSLISSIAAKNSQ